jgi:hypothetical protein
VIFRNSFTQSGAMITGYIFSFILAPIMLARLGLELFGIWAVTGAFATYAALMELGITRALERFVAFYEAHNDRRGRGAVLRSRPARHHGGRPPSRRRWQSSRLLSSRACWETSCLRRT